MQSFLQKRQILQYVDQRNNAKQKQTSFTQLPFRLNSIQIPTPSIDREDYFGRPLRVQNGRLGNRIESSPCQDIKHWKESRTVKADSHNESKPESFLIKASDCYNCDPRKWPPIRKVKAIFIAFCIVLVCGWASGPNPSSISKAAIDLHVSKEAETLATSLFLFGIAIGALVSGPLSETVGRSPAYLISMSLYMAMVFVTAVAPNFAVQIIFRFLAGLFTSPSLTIYGGGLAGLYDAADRSLVWPIFALSPILGPIFAPVAGGFIVQSSSISWRWVDWMTLAISGFVLVLACLFLPETFSPILLQWKAKHIRQNKDDDRYKTSSETGASLPSRLKKNVSRPVIFFTSEPIVIALGFYMTLIYVLVFTFMTGFTSIFVNTYGFSEGQKGVAFLSIIIRVLVNTATAPLYIRRYVRRLHKAEIKQEKEDLDKDEEPTVAPEERLLPALVAAPLLPMSLFWLGWTNRPSITPWSDLAAACLFGFSLMGIFVSGYQYIIDSYETDSASALSSITFLRYLVVAGMVVAAMPKYKAMGVKWVMTLMGSLGILLILVPFLFLV